MELSADDKIWAENTLKAMAKNRREWWDYKPDIAEDSARCVAYGDEILAGERGDALLKLLELKPWLLIEVMFTIVDKQSKVKPFFFNEVQQEFIEIFEKHGADKEHPYVILKGRQQGFTSLITAMQLSYMIMRQNFQGATLTDESSKTIDLFETKAKQVYERIPHPAFKPTKDRDNLNQLSFAAPLTCSWKVRVATDDTERGKTLNFLHMSEVATFQCLLSDLQAGAIEGVVPEGVIIYESTANGYNQFKDLCDKKSNIFCFFEWWKTQEYRRKDTDVLNELTDSWIKERIEWLRTEKGLDEQQLSWYAAKYNSYVEPEKIKQEYPCTAAEAFLSTGACIFNTDQITKQMDARIKVKDVRTGYFNYKIKAVDVTHFKISDIEWVDDPHGYIRIHVPPLCKVRFPDGKQQEMWLEKAKAIEDVLIVGVCPYSIGGDTAGEGSDYFSGKVINNITGEVSATLHIQNIDDDLYAHQMYCLGLMYNEALIGIEVNFSYEPTKELLRLEYPNMYVREKIIDEATAQEQAKFGFHTSPSTRPVIIAELQKKFRNNPRIENDVATLSQMMTFVRNEKGKAAAAAGEHDDLVMGLAIAEYLSSTLQGEHEYAEYKEREIGTMERLFGIRESSESQYECNGIEGYADYD